MSFMRKFTKFINLQPSDRTQFRSKVVSIPKVKSLAYENFLRNETTSNFQSGFEIFGDLLKKNIHKT